MVSERTTTTESVTSRRAIFPNSQGQFRSFAKKRSQQKAAIGAKHLPIHSDNLLYLHLTNRRACRRWHCRNCFRRPLQNHAFDLKFSDESKLLVERLP